MLVDPDGRFGLGGAIGGGSVSFITQVSANYAANGGDLEQAIKCVDIGDVAISAIFGGLGFGALGVVTGKISAKKFAAGAAIGGIVKKFLTPAPARVEEDNCKCPSLDIGAEIISKIAQ